MKTLIIGDMNRVEELYDWMEISQECFEVELIISEINWNLSRLLAR